VVEEAQFLSDNPLGSESSLASKHPNSSLVDKKFMRMKYSTDTTHISRSGASFDYAINISSHVPYEQESIPLSLSTLPPSPRDVSFD
jgi:hypothetical protein